MGIQAKARRIARGNGHVMTHDRLDATAPDGTRRFTFYCSKCLGAVTVLRPTDSVATAALDSRLMQPCKGEKGDGQRQVD